ncbi:MAG: DUF4105 domain-containing protein [Pseudomonadota bacterium]
MNLPEPSLGFFMVLAKGKPVIKHVLLCLLFAFTTFNVSAESDLSNSWQWRKLLQYNEIQESEVKQEDFFFSPQGKTNPQAELEATIDAFSDEANICNFPARHMLINEAGLLPSFDYSACDDFVTWQKSEEVDTATLVFADGYLKNPASFHGHLFIKLGESSDTDLLDNSLNFGAKVPTGVDPVTYIINGLFGGYEARYSAQPFYRHNLSYGQVELRNLWDYELDISTFDAQLLAAHLYELSRTEYTYYFTNKNCAYYVARAIELVAGEYLVTDRELTVFPSEIIQRVAAPKASLVRKIELNESEQKRFQSKYHALSVNQQEAVNLWVTGSDRNKQFRRLSESEQKQVLITLASYYTFRQRQSPEQKQHRSRKQEVLTRLLQYPAGNNLKIEASAEEPHLGQKPNMFRLSRVLGNNHANRWEVAIRPTYYDRLQPKVGKPKNSALRMGEITISLVDNNFLLEDVTLIDITSFNVSSTGLPGDGGSSWVIKTGASRNRLRGAGANFSAYVEGHYGWSGNVIDNVISYALVGGRIHDKELSGDEHNLTIESTVGLEGQFLGSNWFCEIATPLSIAERLSSQDWRTNCGISFVNSGEVDLRLVYEKQNNTNLTLGLSYYF